MNKDASFAAMVKSRRTALGMSQVALADLVGRSASAVRSWERGASTPSDENVVRSLAAVLGIPDADLRAAVGLPTETPAAGGEVAEVGSLETFLPDGAAQPEVSDGEPHEEVEEASAEPEVADGPDADQLDEKLPEEPGDEPGTVEPQDADGEPAVPEQPEPQPAVTHERPDPVPVAAVPAPPTAPAVTSRTVTMPVGARPEPPVQRSYLDDPDQMTTYWIRTALAVALSIFLLVVLVWALGRLGESVGEIWDLFKAGT